MCGQKNKGKVKYWTSVWEIKIKTVLKFHFVYFTKCAENVLSQFNKID